MTIKRIRIRQLRNNDISVVRQQLLINQNGECLICKNQVLSPVLDHSHKKKIKGTGLIRGVLCRNCNIFLGKIENNCSRYRITRHDLPVILRSIADYLERPHKRLIHPSEKPKEKILMKSSYNHLKKTALQAGVHQNQIPQYPKSNRLTKGLERLFNSLNIVPGFYK